MLEAMLHARSSICLQHDVHESLIVVSFHSPLTNDCSQLTTHQTLLAIKHSSLYCTAFYCIVINYIIMRMLNMQQLSCITSHTKHIHATPHHTSSHLITAHTTPHHSPAHLTTPHYPPLHLTAPHYPSLHLTAHLYISHAPHLFMSLFKTM